MTHDERCRVTEILQTRTRHLVNATIFRTIARPHDACVSDEIDEVLGDLFEGRDDEDLQYLVRANAGTLLELAADALHHLDADGEDDGFWAARRARHTA
jgi:hypothetical protein